MISSIKRHDGSRIFTSGFYRVTSYGITFVPSGGATGSAHRGSLATVLIPHAGLHDPLSFLLIIRLKKRGWDGQ